MSFPTISLRRIALLPALLVAISTGAESESNSTTGTTSLRICSVPNGLEVVRIVSSKTRTVFGSALEDADLLRESATEAMGNGGVQGGFTTLEALAATLDWRARGLPEGTTTVDALLGYTDDREDRRVDRYVSMLNEPFVGTKETDMAICETLVNLLPWVIDRQAKEDFWWRDHQNGHSEGPLMAEKVVDQLYTGAWINTYGDALWYYPPLSVFGHPLTMGDIFGPEYDSHIIGNGIISAYFPWNNDKPPGVAFLSSPYPDITVPGLSMITAGAPMFYTGDFEGHTYNDTFVAVVGIDIAITAMSGLVDALDGTLTTNSFALVVDLDFYSIVISQPTVDKLFPPMTGMEGARITYDLADGTTIVQDRRNQTYLVSDTIVQPLTNLQNADWSALQKDVLQLQPGDRGYSMINITITGDTEPTLMYAMYERWPDVADWALIAFAPVDQVDKAIHVGFVQDSIKFQIDHETTSLSSAAVFVNQGSLDVSVSLRSLPGWIRLTNQPELHLDGKTVLKAGSALTLAFTCDTTHLLSGTTTSLVTLVVEDASYSECFYSQTYSMELTIEMARMEEPKRLGAGQVAGAIVAGLIVVAALIFAFFERRKRREDSIWEVEKSELKFADPPEVIGRGTFGQVLLADYRGTMVAVKRVIPPKNSGKNRAGGNDQIPPEQAKEVSPGSISTIRKMQPSGTISMAHKTGAQTTTINFIGGKPSDAAKLKKLKKDFIQEMRTLAKLRHPSVTTVMGAVIGKNEDPMLIMEYCEHGSLYDLLHNETMVLEGEILLPILRDITQGVRFLHGACPQIIHGDLKSANILVDSKFRGKVADFGLSQKESLLKTSKAVYGTPYWMAPELLRGDSVNTTKSDVYAFSILLYEVFTRKEPYEGEDYDEVLRLVRDSSVCKRPPVPEKECDAQIQCMMKDCWVDDPLLRPSFEELDERMKRVDVKSVDREQANKRKGGAVSLFDIFPRHIAEALRDGKKVESEHRDAVCIFFSDIVGFTTISSTLEPRKIADMLDRLYTKFDQLSHEHDVFKVETIGDAYMAVTNLVKDQSKDHTKRIADFAVDAMRAANETLVDSEDPSAGYLKIRVGFHSGPVVADVVGNRNPRYCLFGDTVNVASRMESLSQPNCINCSESAANFLQEQKSPLKLFSRGKVHVKGKGKMNCFWVHNKPVTEEGNVASPSTAASSNLDVVTEEVSERFLADANGHKTPLDFDV